MVLPISRDEANAFVQTFHRHTGRLPSSKFQCAAVASDTGLVVGVAMAGLPKARHLAKHRTTLEVSRVCTTGEPNACSMLYAACVRAGKALGYRRFVTYTLEHEEGASLRAAGWTAVETYEGGQWTEARGAKNGHDTGPKVRWEIRVDGDAPDLRWPDAVRAPQLSLFEAEA